MLLEEHGRGLERFLDGPWKENQDQRRADGVGVAGRRSEVTPTGSRPTALPGAEGGVVCVVTTLIKSFWAGGGRLSPLGAAPRAGNTN